jgi:hypothetical protein
LDAQEDTYLFMQYAFSRLLFFFTISWDDSVTGCIGVFGLRLWRFGYLDYHRWRNVPGLCGESHIKGGLFSTLEMSEHVFPILFPRLGWQDCGCSGRIWRSLDKLPVEVLAMIRFIQCIQEIPNDIMVFGTSLCASIIKNFLNPMNTRRMVKKSVILAYPIWQCSLWFILNKKILLFLFILFLINMIVCWPLVSSAKLVVPFNLSWLCTSTSFLHLVKLSLSTNGKKRRNEYVYNKYHS